MRPKGGKTGQKRQRVNPKRGKMGRKKGEGGKKGPTWLERRAKRSGFWAEISVYWVRLL